MLKSKKTILGFALCAVMALCLTVGIFSGISTSKTTYALGTEGHSHTGWTSVTELPTGAGDHNIYLTDNITLTETWTVPEGTTNLCLNGYVINANGGDFSVITIPTNATLNLYDCDTTTEHKGYFDANGLWHLGEKAVLDTGETAKAITGGIITGGNSSTNGGGINVSGTFNMYGGNIAGNTAQENGGGVSNTSGFTMTGGIIIGNNATKGGGVYASPSAFLANLLTLLTGGTITDNTAQNGGGVYYKEEECFAPGTLITMADGTRQAIETLNIGDSVRVFDHEKGEISSSKIFDVWTYPEKHSGVVKLYFSNDIDVTVVYGHSFFEHEQNKYVSVTRDNVSAFVGHEFYNVDNERWETLEGYEFIDGEVDTYVITTEYQLNCVASGMLTNEDGFYTLLTNIFEYGDNLKIDQVKKAQDIANFGLYGYENIKHMSKHVYDILNFQYLKVAFGKGLISESEFNYLEAYYAEVDTELYCNGKEETPVESKSILLKSPLKAPLLTSSVSAPTSGFYVGGSIKIINNTSGNLYINGGKIITIGTGTVGDGKGVAIPNEDMKIGITLKNGVGPFTNNGTAEDVKYFTSDNAEYDILFNTESKKLECYHAHNNIKFLLWTETSELPTEAGNYVLTTDVAISETWAVPEGVTNLCLNGYVIKANCTEDNKFSVITVGAGATLNLYDCGTTEHNGYVDANGLWHLDEANSHVIATGETTKKITGGIITGGNASGTGFSIKREGGGVHVAGTLNMFGGNIAGNIAQESGGGVYVADGSFTMNGGAISYNYALGTGSGGGIFGTNSSITLNSGTISHNSAHIGGGIYLSGTSSMEMNGGIITDNTARNAQGGGIYANFSGTFTMTAGSITNNQAVLGGGIFVSSDQLNFSMSGGTITGNNVSGTNNKGTIYSGGGVCVYLCNTVTLGGTAQIIGNTLKNDAPSNLWLIKDKTITLGTREHCENCNDTGICQTCGGIGVVQCPYCGGKVNGCEQCDYSGVVKCEKCELPGVCTESAHGNGVWTPTEDMSIGITLANGAGAFTIVGISADYLTNFFSDNANYGVYFDNAGTEGTTDDFLALGYAITNNCPEEEDDVDGYITVDKSATDSGDTVTITITELSGYKYTADSLKATYNDGEKDVELELIGENNAYTFTMPAYAVTVTATFVEKQTISISEEAYHSTYNGESVAFQITSGEGSMPTNLKFEYYVNGDWTETAPTNAGSYNVKITRAEDDKYKAYEKEITNGLVIAKQEVSAPTIENKTYTGETLTADVEESDLYSATKNDGGINAGEYDVKLTLTDSLNYKWTTTDDAEITLKFIIDYAKINEVDFGDVAQPVATETAPTTVSGIATGSRYAGTISWSPALNDGDFDYNTAYTVTITLDIVPSSIDNYRFADNFTLVKPTSEGWTKSTDSTNTQLIYTKTFEKTGKIPEVVEITNDISKTYDATAVSSPIYTKLGEGTVTVEYKLASEDDDKYTTTAPINAGSYVVRVSVAGTETHLSGFTTKAFTISQREVTLTWGETTFAYNGAEQLPTATAGNLANDDNVTVTVVPNKENINAGDDYVATATALSNDNYKLAETNLTTNFVINKADYDMSGITFADKTVKESDSAEIKKLAISGTLPTGLDGKVLTVSYVDNDNTERGVYTVTAKFSTTSTNYNTPSDMTAVLTILWVRDAKTIGTDDETVIVTSETGIDPTLTLKVDVVKIDNNNSQYKEVTDSIKKEDSFNAYLDKIFGVYDVSLIDQNDVKVQPDGTIKVYMQIPELIKDCEFRIYHIHNGVASKADYVIDDGYAVIETDELSEFVFVYEQTSLLPWIIVLSVISALGLAGIVLLLVKNKKDKQGRE